MASQAESHPTLLLCQDSGDLYVCWQFLHVRARFPSFHVLCPQILRSRRNRPCHRHRLVATSYPGKSLGNPNPTRSIPSSFRWNGDCSEADGAINGVPLAKAHPHHPPRACRVDRHPLEIGLVADVRNPTIRAPPSHKATEDLVPARGFDSPTLSTWGSGADVTWVRGAAR